MSTPQTTRSGPQGAGTTDGADDAGIALLSVIMLVLVVATLSLLAVGAVMAQVKPLSYTTKTAGTIAAAESGSQAALAAVRAATRVDGVDGKTYGDTTRLPCQLAGTLPSRGPVLAYAVTVDYYTSDPSQQPASWLAANHLTCSASSGVSATGDAPKYALITSTATQDGVVGIADTSGNRLLRATYALQTTSLNIPGGLFWSYGKKTCLQVRGTAVEGAALEYAAPSACQARTADLMWVHDTDNKLKLASTLSASSQLCVTAVGSAAQLEQCAPARTDDQVLSYTGQTFSMKGARCLWSERRATPSTDGIDVAHVSRCSSNDYTDWWSWSPEPAVGAGDSGYASGQFVNYKYFGSCFEITREDPWANVEGVAPCKHAGASTNTYNQVWTLTTSAGAGDWPTADQPVKSGTLSIKANNHNQRCLSRLETTRSDDMGTWSPDYPALADCNGTPQQRFTVIGYTGDYYTSYLIKDDLGRCLGSGPVYHPAQGFDYPTVIAAACTGGPEQRWNAPANLVPGDVNHVLETPVTR